MSTTQRFLLLVLVPKVEELIVLVQLSAEVLFRGYLRFVTMAAALAAANEKRIQNLESLLETQTKLLSASSKAQKAADAAALRQKAKLDRQERSAQNKRSSVGVDRQFDVLDDLEASLVAAQRVPAGMMILEEPPLIVAFKSTSSLQEHHYERWLAYGTLRANARMSGASNHAALVRAFDAFDSLGVAAAVPSHVREGAAHGMRRM